MEIIKSFAHLFKFGSIEWQDEMIRVIKEKIEKGIELNANEKAFIPTQARHTGDILEGVCNND